MHWTGHTYDPSRTTHDPYPSRVTGGPRILPRRDPVVYGGADAEGPLSAEEVEAFERDGFLILRGLFTREEVARYRAELSHLAGSEQVRALPETITERGSGEVRSIFRVHLLSRIFERMSRDRRLVERVSQLLDSQVYVYQSRVNYKPGMTGERFFWHSDFETWHTEDGLPRMRTVSASINLTPNYEFNGPLMLIPGSQWYYVSCVGETPEDNYLTSLQDQTVGVPDPASIEKLAEDRGIVTATGEPGTALLFDSNVMHGSAGNMTPYPRSNVFFVYNSVDNPTTTPYAGTRPRPDFLAAREIAAIAPE
ncbi:MAG: ectoine hydroxylase [Myxococcota bacterium]